MRTFGVGDRRAVRDFIAAGRRLARENASKRPDAAAERRLFAPGAASAKDRTLRFLLDDGARALVAIPRDGGAAAIGFFECRKAPGAAAPLLSAAIAEARAAGAPELLGPMNLSTWYRYRFLTGGREGEGFALEPDNPPWYPQAFLEAGFAVRDRYYSALCRDPRTHIARSEVHARRFYAAGYAIRQLSLSRWDEELTLIHKLTMAAFPGAPYFTPLDFGEFRRLYAPVRPFVDPRLCAFAVDPRGAEIGFVFALPDWPELRRGFSGPAGSLRLLSFLARNRLAGGRLMARSVPRFDRVILKTLAVAPGFRRVLPGPVLGHWLNQRVLDLGLDTVIHALMHESNYSLELSGWSAEPFREYALYGVRL